MTIQRKILLPILGVTVLAASVLSAIELVLNPYESVEWDRVNHHKANFHCHTTVSDGRAAPHEMVDEYLENGYTILALTDHHRVTYPWTAFDSFRTSRLAERRAADGRIPPLNAFQNRNPEELGMVAVAGGELAANHDYLSLFTDYTSQADDLDTDMTEMARYSEDALAVLAHPALHWPRDFGPKPGLRVPFTPALRQLTQGDFTVEAWFRVVDSSRSVLMGNGAPGRDGVLNLKIQSWINEVRLTLRPGEGGRTMDLFLPAHEIGLAVNDRKWHHLAAVRRDGMILVYLDGEELGRETDVASGFDLEGEEFFIGRDMRAGVTKFNGDIDDVRLWRRGLTHDEIRMLALAGNDSFPDRTGLLAEYRFEISGGQPAGAESGSLVDDTAGHEDGPFHAETIDGGFYIGEVAEPMAASGRSSRAMSFDFPFPESVYPAAFEFYRNLIVKHDHLIGTEVVNGSRADQHFPLDRELWDRLLTELMPDRPVWGFATDDAHTLEAVGRDWVVFPLEKLSRDSVRKAMIDGAFYFSTIRFGHDDRSAERTPVIESIVHDEEAGVLVIRATEGGEVLPEESYRWVSRGEWIHTGSRLAYREVGGVGNYVRVEVTGSGGSTYSNPFGFAPSK